MKVIILCGGKGQRMQSGSEDMPKPMMLINGKPMIHHIMSQYAKYGFNDFILPIGYKGEKIKQYFIDFEWNNSDFTKQISNNAITYHNNIENFKVTIVDTGIETMTGARIKKVSKYIDSDTFMVTYGDGLSDINISELLKFHNKKGKIATVTGIKKKNQYGVLKVKKDIAKSFEEKSTDGGIINGGFFVFNKRFLEYLTEDLNCILEEEPMRLLVENKELAVFSHNGLWLSVDTKKDLITANEIWKY